MIVPWTVVLGILVRVMWSYQGEQNDALFVPPNFAQ